ncbi:MAG TPA: hypothetical protein VFY71_04050 [Planctomycetota bacterium]|nr:hypothetical protein [Planctomycetota bacterium]
MQFTTVRPGIRRIAAAAVLLLTGAPLLAQEFVKLVKPDAYFGDQMGSSVALSDDTLIVGVPQDDNSGGQNAGAALLYLRDGASWDLQGTLLAWDPAPDRAFGQGVACSGDTVAVVSFGDFFGAGSQGGSVHVFERSGADWFKEALLMGSPSKPYDGFGWAIALEGDTLVVAYQSANDSKGAVEVYVHSGSSWLLQSELVADDAELGDMFGASVALSGNTLVVGASRDDTGGFSYAGSAYVFVRNGSSWMQQGKLLAADPGQNDNFGYSVAVYGDTAIVGARQDHIGSETQAGSAYVFVRSGTSWSQQAKLIASDATHADFLGSSVALAGDLAVVTAAGDDDTALNAGSAYLFFRSGTVWAEHGKLHSVGASSSAFFGMCVSLSGGSVAFGAPNDGPVQALGIGSTYIYDLPFVPWTDLGFGLAGVDGIPMLHGSGSLVAGSSGGLALSLAQPSAPSLLFASLADTPAPFKGGVLHTLPPLAQVPLATSASGGWTLPWASWPAGIPAGLELYFQAAVSDTAALHGVSLSNVLKATQP